MKRIPSRSSRCDVRSGFGSGIALALVFVSLLVPRKSSAQGQEADPALRFIPDDAAAVVVAYPRKLSLQKEMELMPLEVITAMGLAELGFDPLDVDQAAFFYRIPADIPLPELGFILSFNKPYDPEKLSAGILRNSTPDKVDGRDYLRAAEPGWLDAMLVDDKTLLLGGGPAFEEMLKSRSGNGAAVKRLKALKSRAHLSAVVLPKPLRPVLQDMMLQAPRLPPPFEALKALPEQLSAIELHASLAPRIALRAVLQAENKEKAAAVEQNLLEAIDAGKEMFLAETAGGLESEDAIARATAQYTRRIADSFTKSFQPKLVEDRVEMSVQADSGLGLTGALVGLLLPAVQQARGAAQRVQSINNLKQLVLGMHNFHDVFDRLPSARHLHRGPTASKNVNLSWRVSILPFIDSQGLYEQFHLDEPWDSEHNKTLIDKMPALYRSPDSTSTEYKSNYAAPICKDSLFTNEQPVKLAILTTRDGASHTVILVEVDDEHAVPWTKPDDWEMDADDPFAGLKQRNGVFQAAFADGSVHTFGESLTAEMWKAMLTWKGGEVVQFPDE